MNKTDLIEVVSQKLGDRRAASAAVESVVDAITRAVARGEKVGISGFGVFEPVDRAARTARNPTTGEAVRLERTRVPKFRPGQGFKDIVSGAKEVSPISGDRAVTARAGVPRAGVPRSAVARTPAKAAKAPAKAAKAPAKAAKAAGTAAKAPGKAAVPAARSALKAPAGRTVAAPGAARSAAAAKAPGRTAAAKAPAAKAPAKRSSR